MANNNIANVNKNDLGFLGEEYQKLFVKCLIEDKQYFSELYSVLDQNKFTNENLRRIVGFMKDRYAEVEIAPSYSDLKVIIRSRVSDEISRNIMISMLKEIYNLKMESIDLIVGTCSPAKRSSPYGLSSKINTPCFFATCKSCFLFARDMVRPDGFWNVGMV